MVLFLPSIRIGFSVKETPCVISNSVREIRVPRI